MMIFMLVVIGLIMRVKRSLYLLFFFFSSRRRHTRFDCDWSSDVCSSDLGGVDGVEDPGGGAEVPPGAEAAQPGAAPADARPGGDEAGVPVVGPVPVIEIGRASRRERV